MQDRDLLEFAWEPSVCENPYVSKHLKLPENFILTFFLPSNSHNFRSMIIKTNPWKNSFEIGFLHTLQSFSTALAEKNAS